VARYPANPDDDAKIHAADSAATLKEIKWMALSMEGLTED